MGINDLVATIETNDLTTSVAVDKVDGGYNQWTSGESFVVGESKLLILKDGAKILERIPLTDECTRSAGSACSYQGDSCEMVSAPEGETRLYVDSIPRLKKLYRKRPQFQAQITEAVSLMLDFAREKYPSQEQALIDALMKR